MIDKFIFGISSPDMKELTGTERLEAEKQRLAEQMNVDAEAVEQIIAENARVAQDQAENSIRYEALVSRFETTKAEYEEVTEEIRNREMRQRELGRFIAEVEKMPQTITEFDEVLWGSLVDHVTVHSAEK